MSRRKQRKIIQTKDRKPIDVSSTPHTAGYKPVPHIWFQRPIDLPPFSFATIRGMLLDPGVRLNFATRAAPLSAAQFGYKQGKEFIEGIECREPEIGAFVYRQLQHIWHSYLPCLLRAQVWGWSAGEVVLKLSSNGVVEINKLEPRHAADCRMLKVDHKRWGVAINRVEGEGTVNLPFPYSFFHSYNAEDGDDYGVSAALGGYSPWAEKWFNGGALDVRRLFMHKDAYAGADLGYPDGETWVPGVNEPVPNVDIARQIVEQLTSGGVTVRPSERDENGNEKWPLTRAQVANNPQHILQYPKDLDQEIRQGMEIADDVISADGGGAWAGKRVTIAGFYASLDQWLVQIVCDLKEQLFDPLVMLNWGHVPEYEIKHKPLAEQAMEQQSNAGPGLGEQPQMPQSGGGMPSFSPQNGTIKPGASGELVFNDGRWRSRDNDPLRLSLAESYAEENGVWAPASELIEAAAKTFEATKPTDAYKFSSTQFDLPEDLAREIIEAASFIPDQLLAKDGREAQPHVTVKYGLHTGDPEAVRSVASGFGQVTITLGAASCFCSDEYDVLKLDVVSDRLRELNALLSERLEVTDTYPTYIPHATIAYVTKGAGEKLAWMIGERFKGRKAELRELTFSGKQREKVEIALVGDIQSLSLVNDDKLGEGQWITIGGDKGADGKRVGGQAALIGKDGKLKTGAFAGSTMEEAFGKGGKADQKESNDQSRDGAIVNLPLDKRGSGSLDSQIDKHKQELARASKATAKENAASRKADKTEARELFNLHAKKLAERTAEKHGIGEKDALKHLDSLVKWEPGKAIEMLKRFAEDESKANSGLAEKRAEPKPNETREDGTPATPIRQNVYTVPTDKLKVDPARFQYKVKGIGASGVGDELKGTQTWNPDLGGVLLVWRDPEDGQDYVVNGHHRHELAARVGSDKVNARYIEAPTPKHARAIGALANIAEGRGTAVDAAKYLRDSEQDIEHLKRAGISMSGRVAADAANLVKLSDKSFAAVTRGDIEEDKAAAVAKHLESHELQDKLFKKLQQREDDGKDWSTREVEAAARKMSKAGKVTQTGTDLFGDWESEDSTFDQEVEIEAYINRQLATEANDFAAVSSTRRAERVSETGNVINVDENLRKRDSARTALADFDRESGLKGDISEAIKAQAAKLAKATRKTERETIKKYILEQIRSLLTQADQGGNNVV